MKKEKYNSKITIYGYDVGAVEKAAEEIAKQLLQLKLIFNGPQPLSLPKQKKKFALLISPHKHKKAQEQFEHTTHRRVFFIYSSISPSTLKLLEDLSVPRNAHFRLKSFF
jgi:small subunit ribosomal protein S10